MNKVKTLQIDKPSNMEAVSICFLFYVLSILINTGVVTEADEFNMFDFIDVGQGKKLISDHLIPDKDEEFCHYECPKNSSPTFF